MYVDENDRGYLVGLDDGSFVERDVLNIIEKIYYYDPNLKVQYLEQAASVGDAPWRLIERCNDGQWRTVFYIWNLDERVLDRLYAADTHRHNVLAQLDTHNASVKRDTQRRYEDKRLESIDITKHVVASPKGRYSFNIDGRWVQVDDDPLRQHKVRDNADS
jgi:hypothetical protein